eukprot:TRINITY_DN1597_c0_g1_i4.p1 TRINITY_DN1597_c0_g1~~TRINITY_DN1597_c0_g1_i4.p1  ORF type:complete len:3086 (-),score=717.12 TRINITY_DN1597_c0_g1_i4:161-9034(-)
MAKLDCLTRQPKGCLAINDKLTCLSSIDDTIDALGGLKLKGQPCVWCGGASCNTGSDSKCAPYDYLARGAGKAFRHIISLSLTAAKCYGTSDNLGDLSCLKPAPAGCNALKDWQNCTLSKDARPYEYIAGLKVKDQPCVWCAGGHCHDGSPSLCEPYDFVLNGPGHAFNTRSSQGVFTRSACNAHNKPWPVALPSDAQLHGSSMMIECGIASSMWSKVRRACGACKALVANIKELFANCKDYCAAQGGLQCASSSKGKTGSCVAEASQACDAAFQTGEDAICECMPDAALGHAAAANFEAYLPRPSEADMMCLNSAQGGCSSIRSKLICLSSKDGSGNATYKTTKINDEPCVWCGGGLCTADSSATCAPYDFLSKGQGVAFPALLMAPITMKVASCQKSSREFNNVACLTTEPSGCPAIRNKTKCLSSIDGRPFKQVAGLKVQGQPCVWCGGGMCNENTNNLCEPYEFAVNGEGHAYNINTAKFLYETAACQDGKPVSHTLPSAETDFGIETVVDCGFPAPIWYKVSKKCGFCKVQVAPKTLSVYKSCDGYCAAQHNNTCVKAFAGHAHSCDQGAEQSCSRTFSEGEHPICECSGPTARVHALAGPRPADNELACLKSEKSGCSAIKTKLSCLSGRDGSGAQGHSGIKIQGEPCVWCGGLPCTDKTDAVCAPYDWMARGQGVEFAAAHGITRMSVATCQNHDDAVFTNLKCLTSVSNGCNSIQSEETCLKSLDGRPYEYIAGLKVAGQPCVWCGGGRCHSSSASKCEPYDFAVNGEGHAFGSFHATGIFKVASCEDGHVASQMLLSGISAHGTSLSVECGASSQVWSKVSRTCGKCKVVVPKIKDIYNTCTDYCAHQPGAPKCVDGAVAHPYSCDVASPQTCDHSFGPGENALCTCGEPQLLLPHEKVQIMYAQCGGKGWNGYTLCEAGAVCNPVNEYYSQCVPAGSAAPGMNVTSIQDRFGDVEAALGAAGPGVMPPAPAVQSREMRWWIKEKPSVEEMSCLKPVAAGCSSQRTRWGCLSGKDGREGLDTESLKVGGEPCVWCGGGICSTYSDALCEPYDWLMKGEGSAFTTLHAKATYSVAKCYSDGDAIFHNLKCLKKMTSGCNSLKNATSCLAAVDGRPIERMAGLQVAGQPCVWCGGAPCHEKSSSLCEPYDFVVNGEGKAFSSFLGKLTYNVAGCEEGHPISYEKPDHMVRHGVSQQVHCGNPMPTWSKVSKMCSQCDVLVPRISDLYPTCKAYCAAQGISCAGAAAAYSHSCDIRKQATCDTEFEAGEDARCHCDPAAKLKAPTAATASTAIDELGSGSNPALGSASALGAACSANPACAKLQLAGNCCPNDAGVRLECCSPAAASSEVPQPGVSSPEASLGAASKMPLVQGLTGPMLKPTVSEMQCLKPEPQGCGYLKNKLSCLSSKDGRTDYAAHGLKVGGEPCVWCGGLKCTSGSESLCQPYDWIVNGAGKAYTLLLAPLSMEVATCRSDNNAIFDPREMQCLTKQKFGCNSIKDMSTCLSSVDDRPYEKVAGFLAAGQPCVWCGGITCNSNNGNMCEPYDFVMNGAGHAFPFFHAKHSYMVAACEAGHPVAHPYADALADRGMPLKVRCGNPMPVWTGVGKTCGNCKVLVPNIQATFTSCTQYCAAQGGAKCISADLTFSRSCDIQKPSTCDHRFDFGESAQCHCDPLLKASKEIIEQADAMPAAPYWQCGGVGYSGTTKCDSGSHCEVFSADYSMCLPDSGASPEQAASAVASAMARAGKSPKEQATAAAIAAQKIAKQNGLSAHEAASAAADAAAAAVRAAGVQGEEAKAAITDAVTAAAQQAGLTAEEAAKVAQAQVKQFQGGVISQGAEQGSSVVAGEAAANIAKSQGKSADEQVQASIIAAAAAAKVSGSSGAEQAADAAMAAGNAAKTAGLTAEEQVKAAADAAGQIASTAGLGPADALDSATKAAEAAAKAAGLTGDEAKQAVDAAVAAYKDKVKATEDQIAAATKAAEEASASKSPEEKVKAVADAAAESAKKAGMEPSQIVQAAASAAQKTAEEAGLSKPEQVAWAAQAAADAANTAGMLPHEKPEPVKNAALQAGLTTGVSLFTDGMSPASAAAAAYAAAGLLGPKAVHDAVMASVVAPSSKTGGLRTDAQIEDAAKKAGDAARAAGLSPKEQADAIAHAAEQAASASKSSSADAAKAAADAAKAAGMSPELQTSAIAHVASHSAKSPEEAAKAAADAAKAAGLSHDQQADAIAQAAASATSPMEAAQAAADAAKAAGLSPELQAAAIAHAAEKGATNPAEAAKAAADAARTAGLSEPAQAIAIGTAAELAAVASGQSPADAVKAAGDVAKTSGLSEANQGAAIGQAAADAKSEEIKPGTPTTEGINEATKLAADGAKTQGLSETAQSAAIAEAAGTSAATEVEQGQPSKSGMSDAAEAAAMAAAAANLSDDAKAEAISNAVSSVAMTAEERGEQPATAALDAAEAAKEAGNSAQLSDQAAEAAIATAAANAADAPNGVSRNHEQAIFDAASAASQATSSSPSQQNAAIAEAAADAAAEEVKQGMDKIKAVEQAGKAATQVSKAGGKSDQEVADIAYAATKMTAEAVGLSKEETETRAKAAAADAAKMTGVLADKVANVTAAAQNAGDDMAAGALKLKLTNTASEEAAMDADATAGDRSSAGGGSSRDTKSHGATKDSGEGGFSAWQWGLIWLAILAILLALCVGFLLAGEDSDDAKKSRKRELKELSSNQVAPVDAQTIDDIESLQAPLVNQKSDVLLGQQTPIQSVSTPLPQYYAALAPLGMQSTQYANFQTTAAAAAPVQYAQAQVQYAQAPVQYAQAPFQGGLAARAVAPQSSDRIRTGAVAGGYVLPGSSLFNQLDRNHDGVLSREEYRPMEIFNAADTNHDGILSRQEFRAFQEAQASGAMNIMVPTGAGHGAVATGAAVNCPNCGNVYAVDSRFCRKCGVARTMGTHVA